MLCRLLSLFVCLALSIHLGSSSPADASTDNPSDTFVGELALEPFADIPSPDDDGSQPASGHSSSSCHDHCKGVALCVGDVAKPLNPLRVEIGKPSATASAVSILLPPPQ